MSSSVSFPPPFPTLKLARSSEKWAATLAEERLRLEEDLNALRERENNLRDYEARLRAWQADIDAGRAANTGTAPARPASTPPVTPRPSVSPSEDVALQAAWEKLHRARELLEAEQSHLRDDRIALREQHDNVKRREDALAEREARLAEREALVAAATPASKGQPIASEHTMSAVTRLTLAPFEMARSVFGGKR